MVVGWLVGWLVGWFLTHGGWLHAACCRVVHAMAVQVASAPKHTYIPYHTLARCTAKYMHPPGNRIEENAYGIHACWLIGSSRTGMCVQLRGSREARRRRRTICVLHLGPSVPLSSSGLQKYTQRLSTYRRAFTLSRAFTTRSRPCGAAVRRRYGAAAVQQGPLREAAWAAADGVALWLGGRAAMHAPAHTACSCQQGAGGQLHCQAQAVSNSAWGRRA